MFETLVLVLLARAPRAGPCPARARALPEHALGIVVGLHDLDARRSYAREIEEVRATGANAVSLMPTWSMRDVHDARVREGAATSAQLDEALRVAHARGLAVLVAPTLHLDQVRDGEWRGTVQPPDWDAWFSSYRSLLVDLARLAERHQAEALLVGSELCSSELHEARWRALIHDVREVFHGQLSYQANWDHHKTPGFLDALDLAGSNAYFELRKDLVHPSVDQLVEAWNPYRDELLAWARGLAKPLVITEIGYPSVEGAAAAPWDYASERPLDLEAQRRAYEAFFRVWAKLPGTRGVFLYDWWGKGGAADRDYTPRGKPAEAVLRAWFARAKGQP